MSNIFRKIRHPHILKLTETAYGPENRYPAPPEEYNCLLCGEIKETVVKPITCHRYECVICKKIFNDVATNAYELLQSGLAIEEVFQWQDL